MSRDPRKDRARKRRLRRREEKRTADQRADDEWWVGYWRRQFGGQLRPYWGQSTRAPFRRPTPTSAMSNTGPWPSDWYFAHDEAPF